MLMVKTPFDISFLKVLMGSYAPLLMPVMFVGRLGKVITKMVITWSAGTVVGDLHPYGSMRSRENLALSYGGLSLGGVSFEMVVWKP
jgi:hypothetical protein